MKPFIGRVCNYCGLCNIMKWHEESQEPQISKSYPLGGYSFLPPVGTSPPRFVAGDPWSRENAKCQRGRDLPFDRNKIITQAISDPQRSTFLLRPRHPNTGLCSLDTSSSWHRPIRSRTVIPLLNSPKLKQGQQAGLYIKDGFCILDGR